MLSRGNDDRFGGRGGLSIGKLVPGCCCIRLERRGSAPPAEDTRGVRGGVGAADGARDRSSASPFSKQSFEGTAAAEAAAGSAA